MYWVIEKNTFNEDGHDRLIKALESQGLSYKLVTVVPFEHRLEPEINNNNDDNSIIAMGTYTLCNIAKDRGWQPGSFHNDYFDITIQKLFWKMLNHDALVYKLKDIPELRLPFFIRPIYDTKDFSGFVADWPTFEKWREGVIKPSKGETITGDSWVAIADVKNINSEYRLWIVDKKVITSSKYKVGRIGKQYSPDVPLGVIEFGEEMADKFSPARAYVLDIASTDNGLYVVECNNLNAAGFYSGDMEKLVEALEGMGYYKMKILSDEMRLAHINFIETGKCCNLMEAISPDDTILGYWCISHGWRPIPSCSNCWKPVGKDRMYWANPHCEDCMD